MTEWLTPDDLAAEFQVPVKTVYTWNSQRTGPQAHRLGRHVRYRRADVDAWTEQQVIAA